MNFLSLFTTIALLVFVPSPTDGLKILGIFPSPARSRFFVGKSIMKALHSAGHEITMVSVFPQQKPMKNWTDIDIPELLNDVKVARQNANIFDATVASNGPLLMFLQSRFYTTITALVLRSPTMQPLFKKEMEFDLIISEMTNMEAFIGFAELFNASFIAVSTSVTNKCINDLVGTPQPASYIPNNFLGFTDNMTLKERAGNFLIGILEDVIDLVAHKPNQWALYKHFFPSAKYKFNDALKNVSLAFVNSHISYTIPRPLAPNMIEIGGININRTTKPLPADLNEFISSAQKGVVYISFGAEIQSSKLPPEALKGLIRIIKRLEQKFLWKLDDPSVIKEYIPNLLTRKWFPQNDVLAHENIILFITNGGTLSISEAVYHGVPALGIPVYGDQFMNVAKAVESGWALKLNVEDVDGENLLIVVLALLYHPRFMENAERVSRLFRDRPMTPQQAVVYWSEYVVRHKGAHHLHSKIVDMNYFSGYNIDVYINLALLVLSIMYIANYITNYFGPRVVEPLD